MNMISTGTFLTEMNASEKQEQLVAKLVSAWEKKNAKVARAGGVSLMALSLAACGSSDDSSSSSSGGSSGSAGSSSVSSTTVTLANDGGSYSLSTTVDGVSVPAATAAKIYVNDNEPGDAYSFTLDASAAGSGTLTVEFADAGDTLTLAADSDLGNFTTLEVKNGTIDITAMTGGANISSVIINSGIKATAAQIQTVSSITGSGSVVITASTQAEIDAAIAHFNTNDITVTATFSAASGSTLTAADLTAANTNMAAEVAGNSAADTVTVYDAISLTAGTDSGTSDSFSGAVVANGSAGTTFSAGDNLTGTSGTSDQLTVTLTGDETNAGYTMAGVQTAGIETIQISNFHSNATGNSTLDMALMSGMNLVNVIASSANGDTVLTNVQSITDMGMNSGSGDLTVTYAAATVVGTADSQNLQVGNLTAGKFTANSIETINVTSSVANSTVTDIVSDALKTVTFAGDKNITMSNSIDFAATTNGTAIDGTIDASAMTGKLAATATTVQTVSLKGGSGNDTFTMGATLTKNDVVDGGDGTDTLAIAETANRTFASHQISNIENLELAVTTNNLTDFDVKALADTIGITAKAATTNKDLTINNLGAGQSITVINDSANTLELGNVVANLENPNGTADSMTANLVAKSDADQTLDLLTLDAGAESVTVNTDGASGVSMTAGNEITLTSLIADGATTLNFTGAGNLITTLNQTGTSVAKTIDASTMTGTFGITEAVTNDVTIKGSAGTNTIAMAATLNNKDTIIGGASAKDTVSATIGTATTATTGAFNISGVETLALTTTDGTTATVDSTSISGVTNTTITASGTTGDGVVNLTGLANASKISTTVQATNDFDGTLNLTLADATGTSDSVTINVGNTGSSDNFTVTSTGIETLNVTSIAAAAASGLDISGVDASSIVVTGGTAGTLQTLDQGTNKLNKAVTSLDASAALGDVAADASAANSVGVDFKLGNLSITTTTGDAIVGSGSTTSDDSLSGTFAADDATAEFTQFSAIESYDFTFNNGINITAAASDGVGDGDNAVKTVKMSGGNSLTTYTAATGAIDGTKLTSFDASGLGGEISILAAGSRMDNMTIKGSTASAKDAVTYTAVNGLTATTGKALTEGVETITVRTATAASTIDTSSMTGVTTIAVENNQNVTLTNVAAGVKIQLGESATAGVEDYTGALTVKLADTSGTSDAITVQTVASGTNEDVDAALTIAGVETTTLKISADTAAADVDLNVAGVASGSIIVTGGSAAEDLDLTNGGGSLLNAATTSLDASAFVGTLTASAQTNTATSMSANGGAVATLTGSSGSDTITVGKTAAVTHVLDAGAGADTLNITLGTGTTAGTSYEGIEVYNITAASDAAGIVVTAASSKFFNDTMVQTVTLSGGKDTTTFDSGTDGVDANSTMTLFDASGFNGKINDLLFDADQLAATVTVKGGASTADLVSATFANASTVKMEGVETLGLTFTGTAAVDVGTYVSDMSKLTVTSDGTARVATLSALDEGVTVELTTNDASDGLTIVRGSTSGTADAQSLTLLANIAGEDVLLDMANVETLNVKMSTGSGDTDLSLTNFDMDTAGQTNSLVVTGALNLDVVALSADTTLIDATAMTAGGVDVDGRTIATTALTFKGSAAAAESVIMLNAGDTLDGGETAAIADTLDINFGAVLGGISVDLSAADQIATMDGVANAAVQTNFENVDLAGYTGFGAVITGNSEANVITGTASVDNITGGDGADTINSGAGADVVSLTEATAAIDTIKFAITGGSSSITGFTTGAGGDVLAEATAFGMETGTVADTVLEAAALTNGDAAAEIGNNSTISMLVDNTSRANLLTALNASDFDTTDIDRIFLIDIGTTVEVLLASNEDTNDDNDVSLTLLGTLTDVADIAAGTFAAGNVDFG